MSETTGLEAIIDKFEHSTDRAFHISLARNCLTAIPFNYTDDQLDDIGRRARHYVSKAIREHGLKEQELLPCPFCGSVDVVCAVSELRGDYDVSCNTCGVLLTEEGEQAAVQKWNRRNGEAVK